MCQNLICIGITWESCLTADQAGPEDLKSAVLTSSQMMLMLLCGPWTMFSGAGPQSASDSHAQQISGTTAAYLFVHSDFDNEDLFLPYIYLFFKKARWQEVYSTVEKQQEFQSNNNHRKLYQVPETSAIFLILPYLFFYFLERNKSQNMNIT